MFSKKTITILITDSGLGGMSILGQMVERLKRDPVFPKVTLIYYNAWPEQNRGYNALQDMDERVRVFDRALKGMKRYGPDIILIACNTLSVLYGRTAFSRRESIPVVDIVRFGVEMVYEWLLRDPDTRALLLGTVTTIASGLHRDQLIDRGIASDRITVQPCDRLATGIEKGPKSRTVKQRVDTYMTEAAAKLGKRQTEVGVALFCTHFGYIRNLFKASLEKRIPGKAILLDPNRRMADYLFEASNGIRHVGADVDLQVVSRIVWDPERIEAVSTLLEPLSDETARALKAYQWIPDLFSV